MLDPEGLKLLSNSFTARRLRDHGAARIVAVCIQDLLSTGKGKKKQKQKKTLSVNVCHCSSRRIMFAARMIGETYRGPLPDRNPTACCLCVVLFSPPPPKKKSFMRNHSPTCWNRGSSSSLHRGDLIYCYRLYVCMTLGLIKTPVRWPPNMLLPKYSTSTPDPFLVYERYEIYVRAAR